VTVPATVSDVAVDPDLARRLAMAGRKSEEWRERRDELIREAARNGGTLREIAAAVGLSNPGVLRVIRRGELEVHHVRAHSAGGDDPDNTVFLTPEEHARRDRGEPEA
jgi:transposase-like protein